MGAIKKIRKKIHHILVMDFFCPKRPGINGRLQSVMPVHLRLAILIAASIGCSYNLYQEIFYPGLLQPILISVYRVSVL